MSEKLSYTINEACAATGLGRTFLYDEIAAGRLQRVKVGTRTLIMRGELMRFLNERNSDDGKAA